MWTSQEKLISLQSLQKQIYRGTMHTLLDKDEYVLAVSQEELGFPNEEFVWYAFTKAQDINRLTKEEEQNLRDTLDNYIQQKTTDRSKQKNKEASSSYSQVQMPSEDDTTDGFVIRKRNAKFSFNEDEDSNEEYKPRKTMSSTAQNRKRLVSLNHYYKYHLKNSIKLIKMDEIDTQHYLRSVGNDELKVYLDLCFPTVDNNVYRRSEYKNDLRLVQLLKENKFINTECIGWIHDIMKKPGDSGMYFHREVVLMEPEKVLQYWDRLNPY